MFGGARVLRAATCRGWLTDPPWLSYGPELDAPSAIPFSADLRDTPPSFNLFPASFAQLAMGCPNPSFNTAFPYPLLFPLGHLGSVILCRSVMSYVLAFLKNSDRNYI